MAPWARDSRPAPVTAQGRMTPQCNPAPYTKRRRPLPLSAQSLTHFDKPPRPSRVATHSINPPAHQLLMRLSRIRVWCLDRRFVWSRPPPPPPPPPPPTSLSSKFRLSVSPSPFDSVLQVEVVATCPSWDRHRWLVSPPASAVIASPIDGAIITGRAAPAAAATAAIFWGTWCFHRLLILRLTLINDVLATWWSSLFHYSTPHHQVNHYMPFIAFHCLSLRFYEIISSFDWFDRFLRL